MGKKIVILNGSPRLNENTAARVRSFTKGAGSAGHIVTAFHLGGMDIHGCKGCFGAHNNKNSASNDIDRIYPAVKQADVVVLALPLYYWNMSGQLRTTVDWLFALREVDGNAARAWLCIRAADSGGRTQL